jgi:hypothetical protein
MFSLHCPLMGSPKGENCKGIIEITMGNRPNGATVLLIQRIYLLYWFTKLFKLCLWTLNWSGYIVLHQQSWQRLFTILYTSSHGEVEFTCRVILEILTNVLEKPTASIFKAVGSSETLVNTSNIIWGTNPDQHLKLHGNKMKMYGRVEVQLHAFNTLALDGEWFHTTATLFSV